jgi:hypothetical protein
VKSRPSGVSLAGTRLMATRIRLVPRDLDVLQHQSCWLMSVNESQNSNVTRDLSG